MPSTLDLTYAALADPTRRAILHCLRYSEARVTEIAAPLPISLAAVSKHIVVLERAGLVLREIRGRDHYLRADPEKLEEARRWIADYTSFWETRADALAEHLARVADFGREEVSRERQEQQERRERQQGQESQEGHDR